MSLSSSDDGVEEEYLQYLKNRERGEEKRLEVPGEEKSPRKRKREKHSKKEDRKHKRHKKDKKKEDHDDEL